MAHLYLEKYSPCNHFEQPVHRLLHTSLVQSHKSVTPKLNLHCHKHILYEDVITQQQYNNHLS